MSNIANSETVKHGRREYTINLRYDQDCQSPLENDDGVFITCAKGACEQYGNTPLSEDEHLAIGRRVAMYALHSPAAALAEALREKDADEEPLGEPLIGLPVYVYQHSNVAMSTEAFTCPWDSGQSGFIYITEKTALEWQGGKRMNKTKLANVLKSLESVVEEYSLWCNGECYYYTVEDENGNQINDIGCGGFIGHKYALEEALSDVKHHHAQRVKDACAKRIAVAKERVERLFWAARDVVTA